MQENKHLLDYTITAGQDLSVAGAQYKAVTLAGVIAAAGTTAIGILQTKPQSGQFGSVAVAGIVKARYGAAVNSGAAVVVTTSGFLIAYTQVASGALPVASPVGRALVQVSSGDIAETMVNFLTGGLAV